MLPRRVRKPPGPTATARRKRAVVSKRRENEHKQTVRDQDVTCRFPLCRCRQRGIALHVSHQLHKGMGGNPAGDRSMPWLMILLCARRHREAPISVDRGTLRWRPLTLAGSRGPVAWDVQVAALRLIGAGFPNADRPIVDGWLTLATGVGLHLYAFDPWQADVLERLSQLSV